MMYMKKLNEMIFINNYPKLDLHGFDRDSARVAINDFINDNYKMNNELITIIHGIGTGILKNETRKTLQKHPLVIDFKIYNFNEGCTIVQIKTKQ